MDRGTHSGRDPHSARLPRVAHRAGGARPRATDRPLLRRRQPLRLRREDARGARLRERRLPRRRLHRLEAQRLPDRAAALARRREAAALQPPPPDPRGRRGGPAQAARLARPADRRRRPRLARRRSTSRRPASASSGSSTTTASTSRTSSARSLHSTARRSANWKAESAKRDDRGAQPRRRGRPVHRAAHLGERRADPRRRLGRDRRRRRQLPDALSRQRRGRLARHPARPRLDLPLRGPGDRLQAPRGPVLPLPLPQPPPPELAPSCAEGGVLGVLPGIVGSLQASEALKLCLGIGEPLVGRLLLFDALETEFSEVTLRRDPTARSAARTRRSPSTSTTSSSARGGRRTHDATVRIPPTLRAEVGGERAGAGRGRHRARGARRPDGALPGARGHSSSRTATSRRS